MLTQREELEFASRWGWVVFRGVVAILFGLVAFAEPRTVGFALVLIFAVYAFVSGIAALVSAARGARAREPRWGTVLLEGLLYIVAGAIAESATGKSWEALVRELVFEPLGIREAGFGAPGTPGKLDQPEGHRPEGGRLVAIPPGPDADNPPALGPAGTIRITLADWMRFAQDQLDGVHGRGKLLQPATYRKLHTPVTGNYALGWGAKLAPDMADGVKRILKVA